MHSRSIIGLALASACCIALVGCHKGTGFGPEGNGDGLSVLFANNRANATQSFQVNATNGGTIVGSKGVQVVFGPNAFQTRNGNGVTGTVDVSLLEILDPHDMIWYDVQTVGDQSGTARLLRSGGAVRVQARQGAQQLFLGPQGMYVLIPTATVNPSMGAFTTNGMADQGMVWNLEPWSLDSVDSEFGVYYGVHADSLQWINCDYFASYPQTMFLDAVTSADVDPDSMLLWVAFPSENAVMRMQSNGSGLFRSWQVVPQGMQAVVVGLERNGTTYRSAFTTVTITAGQQVGLSFQPTDQQTFEAALNAI
jgi:hypothetical protein